MQCRVVDRNFFSEWTLRIITSGARHDARELITIRVESLGDIIISTIIVGILTFIKAVSELSSILICTYMFSIVLSTVTGGFNDSPSI